MLVKPEFFVVNGSRSDRTIYASHRYRYHDCRSSLKLYRSVIARALSWLMSSYGLNAALLNLHLFVAKSQSAFQELHNSCHKAAGAEPSLMA